MFLRFLQHTAQWGNNLRFTHKAMIIGGDPATNPDQDRLIQLNGHDVGRATYYNSGAKGDEYWRWTAQTYPAGNGKVDSLDDALAAIKAHVQGVAVNGWVRMSGSKPDIWVG